MKSDITLITSITSLQRVKYDFLMKYITPWSIIELHDITSALFIRTGS